MKDVRPRLEKMRKGQLEPAARLLTIPEAAEACQVSVRQLYRMISDGRLRAVRFGRADAAPAPVAFPG